jgi:hypothetical protein
MFILGVNMCLIKEYDVLHIYCSRTGQKSVYVSPRSFGLILINKCLNVRIFEHMLCLNSSVYYLFQPSSLLTFAKFQNFHSKLHFTILLLSVFLFTNVIYYNY